MPLYILGLLILFVLIDYFVRYAVRKHKENKIIKEREEALKVSLNLDFTNEAKTLKRVDVEKPKARILCVDDEEIILDSFRKILVLDGYSVDTVETGQEALGLIQTHHYDFVFTDLKMPEMSGEDVCKGVKHLRPDIDVIIITGYATVESAVECMKFGAMDYIQKPFTEDELLAFVKRFVIRRSDRIGKELNPRVHITQLSNVENLKTGDFAIPGGVFISKGHCWVSVEQDGGVKIGIDNFAKKIIGRIDGIDKPNLGMQIKTGQPLFGIKQGKRVVTFLSPVSGKVSKINDQLLDSVDQLDNTTYGRNFICEVDAENLDNEIKELKIGNSAVQFYQSEIERYIHSIKSVYKLTGKKEEDGKKEDKYFSGELEGIDFYHWETVINQFFK